MTVGVAGIETISGALKKPKKQNGHNHGSYLIAVHRVAETTNPNCQRLYAKPADAYDRKTPLTAAEMVNRERFGAVTRAVNTRMHDISKISQDQAAFKAQTTYKTMKSYLWAICAQAYDESQG